LGGDLVLTKGRFMYGTVEFGERVASEPVISELAHCDTPTPTSCTSAALFE